VLPVWLRGGTNVILGGFDPERFTATVAAEKITASMMVPTMLYVLMDSLRNGQPGPGVAVHGDLRGVPDRPERLLQAH